MALNIVTIEFRKKNKYREKNFSNSYLTKIIKKLIHQNGLKIID